MRLPSCGLVLLVIGIVFLTSATQARDEFLEFGENMASLLNGGVATQSSQLGGFVADNAIDENFGNFTHTQAHADEPDPAWWEVDLQDDREIGLIVICNRGDGCCQSRLRDIVVEIRDADGEIIFATTDVEDPDPEGILNAENELNNPRSIFVDVEGLNGGTPVTGQIVRVNRLPDPDLSGGAGNDDESTVLQIGEVGVFEDGLGCPAEGDSHCLGLTAEGPPEGDFPGEWTFTVSAEDDSGDLLTYAVSAEHEGGTRVSGASDLEQVVLNLQFTGKWTVTASVDDGGTCLDEAADAECESIEIEIEPDPAGENVALGKPAAQSSQLGAFEPGLAVDGNFGNFHHTSNAQQGPAVWEVDLEDEYEISRIVVHNRGDGCCQARLRDLVVSVHEGSFLDDFIDPEIEDNAEEWVPDTIWEEHSDSLIWQTEEVLNLENEDASPPMIEIELDGVVGQYVRVTRISDLDTSGGAGNPDDPKVLQMGEVEVFGRPGGGPPPGSILKPGDVNNDGAYNIADAVAHLNFLFGGEGLVECFAVAGSDPIELSPPGLANLDFNGDGASNIADAVGSLSRLFGGGDAHVLGEDCAEVEPGCPDSCQ